MESKSLYRSINGIKNNSANMCPVILVVEDEEAIAKPLSRLLQMAHYEVTWMSDGKRALEWLNANPPPDLMLIDIMMPDMTGWEFREAQRKLPSPLNDIPSIFLSADSQSGGKAKELGEHFISKPIDMKLLKSTMAELIEAQRSHRSYD